MTTTFRKTSLSLAIFAIATFGPQLALAADKLGPLVLETKPKLNVGQFVSNCQNIGGTVSDGGAQSGAHEVNCDKDNGLSVTCTFQNNHPTQCHGTGPRPQ